MFSLSLGNKLISSFTFLVHSPRPLSAEGRGRGGFETPIKFSKKGGLIGPQTLRGMLLEKRGVAFFREGGERGEVGCSFTTKKQTKI